MTLPMPKPPILTAESVFRAGDFDPDFWGFGRKDNSNIIAAVSGGSDSLAMLLLLRAHLRAKGEENRLIAVTIDHGLRPESAAEAAYVKDLCRKFAIHHQTLRWRGAKPRQSLQEKARAARYRLLAQAAEKCQAAIICVAHTADDQAETYFMRQARLAAAGEAAADCFAAVRRRGLACMARHSLLCGKFLLLRPLLAVPRADLRRFLAAERVAWRDDPSNENAAYERVRCRKNLTEAAKKQAAAALAAAAAERQALSAAAALWGEKSALRREGGGLLLDLAALKAGAPLQNADYAALYLLAAAAAAICGGKAFIAADDSRLKQFVLRLPAGQKGEKPQRISVSAAVLAKRRGQLAIEREQRRAALPPRPADNPFAFIVSGYDAPLFRLFAPLLPAPAAKTAQTAKKKAAFLPASLGKALKAAYVKGKL